jgi:hypothetical protein
MKRHREPALFVALALIGACAAHNPTPQGSDSGSSQQSSLQPVGPGFESFTSSPHHVAFSYPSAWHPVAGDKVLTLVPKDESSIGQNTILVEQPDLPPHIPGFIPLGSVENGFVDDLKKRYNSLQVDQSISQPLAGADGRLVLAHGLRGPNGAKVVVDGELCVRGDAVYLVVATTDDAHAASARDAFNRIVQSFRWID